MGLEEMISQMFFLCVLEKNLNSYRENHEDADKLGEAEGHTELEGSEGRDHGGPALLNDVGNARDVDVARGEWSGH